jgi:hypothetical protein
VILQIGVHLALDRVIFGDNQFFGINHMSEEKSQAQAERFQDLPSIIRVVDMAYDCGIHAFMFNTHDKVSELCDHFRAHTDRYSDLRLYPSMPYAHKYANAVAEKGILGALNDFLFSGNSVAEIFSTMVRGGKSIILRDMMEVMRLLVDAEMHMFRGLNVRAVFLQNIVTDLLLGMRIKPCFVEFASYIKEKYGVDPAFNTMNLTALVDFLLDCGIENPIVCSSINKIGYLMNPDKESYEATIRTKKFRPMAMSILASGAVPPREAVEYIAGLGKVQSIVFGASSRGNIEQTLSIIDNVWGRVEQSFS